VPTKPRRRHNATRGSLTKHYGDKTKIQNNEIIFDCHPTSVLPEFSNGHGGQGTLHETSKPTDLMSWLILTYTNPGGIVLDPFLGAGSTSAVCKQLGRHCIGIEIREQPLEVARRRLFQESMQFEVPV
jgi:hypothetical protein